LLGLDDLVVMHAPRPFRLAITNPLIVVGVQQVRNPQYASPSSRFVPSFREDGD
jgi:hypothetical protein